MTPAAAANSGGRLDKRQQAHIIRVSRANREGDVSRAYSAPRPERLHTSGQVAVEWLMVAGILTAVAIVLTGMLQPVLVEYRADDRAQREDGGAMRARCSERGQTAVEYLMIAGLLTAMLIVLTCIIVPTMKTVGVKVVQHMVLHLSSPARRKGADSAVPRVR